MFVAEVDLVLNVEVPKWQNPKRKGPQNPLDTCTTTTPPTPCNDYSLGFWAYGAVSFTSFQKTELQVYTDTLQKYKVMVKSQESGIDIASVVLLS